jgi:hypothetical protein
VRQAGRRAGRQASGKNSPAKTLWSQGTDLDAQMLAYTVGDDRQWDGYLLPWDVLGSLGHVEGLRRSRLISEADYRKLTTGLRAAFRAVASGALAIGEAHEDAHSAVELWLTSRIFQIVVIEDAEFDVWAKTNNDLIQTLDRTDLARLAFDAGIKAQSSEISHWSNY